VQEEISHALLHGGGKGEKDSLCIRIQEGIHTAKGKGKKEDRNFIRQKEGG